MDLRWILLIACVFAGCSPAPTSETAGDQPVRTSTDFDRLPGLMADIRGNASLYEGLPGAFWEPQLRESESTSKETTQRHGFRLYEEQPDLSLADSEQLGALFKDAGSFKPYNPQKPCGEFHADYCVEWQTAAGTTEAFVSLECGEAMLFGPQGDLHCDFTPEAGRKVKSLLAPYQENRPVPE